MSQHCSHRYTDGSACKRFASQGSPFCYKHNPEYRAIHKHLKEIPADVRLLTIDDVMEVVRQTLNLVRHGYLRPSQAYAIGYLVHLWVKLSKEAGYQEGTTGLQERTLRVLLDDPDKPETDAAAPPETPRGA